MPRPPLPRRPRHHERVLARAAGSAGVVVVIAGLLACQGGQASTASKEPAELAPPAAATSAPARVAPVTAPVPPPPDLARLVAEAAPASAPADARPASGATTAQALAAAHARLASALARASSCTSDGECRSLAVGGKACGGPTGYEAYSAKLADPATMAALAQREHDLALQEARESHRVSNCLMLGDPGARCEANKCVTGGPRPGPSPATR